MSNAILGPLRTEETGANQIEIERIQARIKAIKATTEAETVAKERPVYKPGETAPPPLVAGKQGTSGSSDLLGKIGENILQGITPAGLGNALAIGGDVSTATGVNPVTKGAEQAANVGSDVAGEVAGGLFGDVKEAFGADFVKGLLYVVLAGGGAMLIIIGISRSTGLHPAQGAKKVATVAATGAVLA